VRKYAASHPREPVPKKPRQVKERAAKPNYYQKRRTELIARYGGACVCCGEDYAPYLELDHVDGGGLADRRRFKTDYAYYNWLYRAPRLLEIQVLCANCHAAKTKRKPCRHREMPEPLTLAG